MVGKPRTLITGIAGFIGSNLADRLLKEGYEVAGIDNLCYGVREQVPQGAEFHELDIRSDGIHPLFRPGDVVFHLAAKNSLPDCQKAPVETADINVRGTVNVFEAARRGGAKKVVYAESSALYEARALGFYAVSKQCCGEFARAYQALGLTTVGLRYFNVYGPRQDYRRTLPPVMSRFAIDLLTGRPAVRYEGDDVSARDFVHVDDVNAFHLACLTDARVDNGVFDLGSGESTSVDRVYELLKEIAGEKVPPVVKPRREDDPPVSTRADIRAARSLGWRPRVSLREGLRGMVEYLKSEIAKGNVP